MRGSEGKRGWHTILVVSSMSNLKTIQLRTLYWVGVVKEWNSSKYQCESSSWIKWLQKKKSNQRNDRRKSRSSAREGKWTMIPWGQRSLRWQILTEAFFFPGLKETEMKVFSYLHVKYTDINRREINTNLYEDCVYNNGGIISQWRKDGFLLVKKYSWSSVGLSCNSQWP